MSASTPTPSVIPLLSSWETYIKIFPQGTIQSFAHWLLANSEPAIDTELFIPILAAYAKRSSTHQTEIFIGAPIRGARPAPESPASAPESLPPNTESLTSVTESLTSEAAVTPPTHPQLDVTQQSTLLITRLTRILSFLSKPTVKKLGFTKDMEFAVLVQVKLMDRPNKKELCKDLLIENSTGVEITRRLAKKGLLLEEADEKDRRSSRLSLTDKGKTVMRQLYEQLGAIHTGFLDALSPDEKKNLVSLLSWLDQDRTRHIANLLPNA